MQWIFKKRIKNGLKSKPAIPFLLIFTDYRKQYYRKQSRVKWKKAEFCNIQHPADINQLNRLWWIVKIERISAFKPKFSDDLSFRQLSLP